MTWPLDRTGWKKPRRRITAKDYDAIIAAVRAEPRNAAGIAERFSLSLGTIAKLAARARSYSGAGVT